MQPADWSRLIKKFLPNPHSTFLKNESGFTLIEMLVVMAIIGILTGGAITSYNSFNRGQTVRRAALDLVSDIRLTQSRAVSGLKDVDCKEDLWNSSASPPVEVLPGAPSDNIEDYKLDGHYLVFVKDDAFYTQQQSCTQDIDSGQVRVAPDDNLLRPIVPEVINLVGNNSVSIDSVDIIGGACSSSITQLTVNFLPLRGVEFFDGIGLDSSTLADSDCQSAQIVLSQGGTKFTITVNLSGQVTQVKQ